MSSRRHDRTRRQRRRLRAAWACLPDGVRVLALLLVSRVVR